MIPKSLKTARIRPLLTFQPLSCDVLASIIHKLNRTTGGLDPFPTLITLDIGL